MLTKQLALSNRCSLHEVSGFVPCSAHGNDERPPGGRHCDDQPDEPPSPNHGPLSAAAVSDRAPHGADPPLRRDRWCQPGLVVDVATDVATDVVVDVVVGPELAGAVVGGAIFAASAR